MAQQKRVGHGALLKRGNTQITQVRVITPPTLSREAIEATDLDSTYVYKVPSDPVDYGEITFETLWTPGETNDELIETDLLAGTVTSWSITFPLTTPRVATFSAWVQSSAPGPLESKDTIKRVVTLVLRSTITWS